MKYYLCALLICGAFFSCYVTAQDPDLIPIPVCLEGEAILSGVGGCGVSAPDKSCKYLYSGPNFFSAKSPASPNFADYNTWLANYNVSNVVSGTCSVSSAVFTHNWSPSTSCPDATVTTYPPVTVIRTQTNSRIADALPGVCDSYQGDTVTSTAQKYAQLTIQVTDEIMCPPDYPLGPIDYDDGQLMGKYCYYIPVDEPPPECDIGDCDPPEPPKCFIGGNGMLICEEDPDEKCTRSDSATIGADGNPLPTYSGCQAGCGFVVDKFMCGAEPDGVPNFEKCEITQTGYVCPSEQNDIVADAEKPIDNMVKGDFKDVNIGIESRQDIANDLLSTQIASDKNNAENLSNQLQGISTNLSDHLNGLGDKLTDIGDDFGEINDSLNPDETRAIDEPESWYTPVYEDGITGLWDDHRGALEQAPLFTFLDQFTLAPSGTQPDWNMCFNLGALGNYGCERLEVPAFIWNFIRIVMLLGAAFTSRRLIFGG